MVQNNPEQPASDGQAGHTPGPWRIEGRRGAGYIISAGMNVEGDGPADYVGVLDPMFWIAGEPNHLKPDVQLCIAAPDLLAACKWAEAALAPFSTSPAERSGINLLRAAILKATANAE